MVHTEFWCQARGPLQTVSRLSVVGLCAKGKGIGLVFLSLEVPTANPLTTKTVMRTHSYCKYHLPKVEKTELWRVVQSALLLDRGRVGFIGQRKGNRFGLMSIHEGDVAAGDRVVVLTSKAWRGTVVRQSSPTKAGFNAWIVKPDDGRAVRVSCISICQNLKPNDHQLRKGNR